MTPRTRRALALSVSAAALTVATLAAQASIAATDRSVTAHPRVGGATGWRIEKTISIHGRSVIVVNIDAVSASDAWVAGLVLSGYDSAERPLLEHWDGSAWHEVSLPAKLIRRFSGQDVFGYVSASSASNVWAISAQGSYLRRVNGHWSFGRLPGSKTGRLFVGSIKVFSPADVWVFGGRSIGAVSDLKFAPYAARFGGRRWTPVKVPGKGLLSPVSALSPRTMWAIVGGEMPFISGPATHGVVERWRHGTWQVVSPQPMLRRQTILAGILVKTDNDVWVSGGTQDSKQGSAEKAWHWNGTAWAQASPRSPAATANQYFLSSLVPAPGGMWGLGADLNGAARIWRYSGGAWSAPVRLRWDLYQLAGVPHRRSIWAIGESADANSGLIVLHGPAPR